VLRQLSMIMVWLGFGCACAPSLVDMPSPLSQSASTPHVRADASSIAYFTQAERFVVQKRFQDAADSYRLALVHDPYSVELHLRLASTLRKLNQWFSAVETLERALVARPQSRQLQLELGRLYVELDDFSSAEKLLKKIGPEDLEFKHAWILRFESALWANRPELIQEIRNLVLHELPEMACVVARLLEDHGEDAAARADYARCPEPTDLDLLRIGFRENGGKLSERFQTYEPEEKLNQPTLRPVSDLNKLNRRGVELRRAHRQRPGDCHVLSKLGHWYGQKNNTVHSMRYLKEAQRRCPTNPAIVLSLAWAYWSQGQKQEALKLSRWILTQDFEAQYCNEALKVIELSDGPKDGN
jgi:tetratricopeptide (TPR) repeat protein